LYNYLPDTDEFANNRTKLLSWLYIAIFALAISGFYSILIVLLRSPGIQTIMPFKSFFSSSLVIHVNMSVLIFMLSIATIWLSFEVKNKYLSFITALLAFFGMMLMAISPFIKHTPILNNYVPVIENMPFFIGLFLFFTGIFLSSITVCNRFIFKPNITGQKAISYSVAILLVSAFFSLFITRSKLLTLVHHNYSKHEFYELMFWGFGHILQFVYFAVYLGFVYKIISLIKDSPKNDLALGLISIINALLPVIAIYNQINTDDYINGYTEHMKYYGGVPFVLLVIYLSIYYKKVMDIKPLYRLGLILSMLLFGAGGIIALYISGTDVTIPAHYHGSTVGITIGLMCFIYMIFIEYFNMEQSKGMKWQLITYTIGQAIHITGLAWSGGYGALRKNHGEILSVKLKISMGFMGAGGLIAIISGLTFIIIVLKCFYKINKFK